MKDYKKYLKELTPVQFKVLVFMGLREIYYNSNKRMIDDRDFNSVTFEYDSLEEWDYRFHAHIKDIIFNDESYMVNASFMIDDYTMTVYASGNKYILDSIIQLYFASEFGNDYVEDLYKKRIEDLQLEKKLLLENSEKRLNYIYRRKINK